MSSDTGFVTSRIDEAIGWARKYSIFQYPFVTACCGMEYMATACSHYDVDRFGAGLPRFSPRQADVLFVVGTISHKIAPVLKRIYDQMAEPKWVVSFGVCTCTGGFYDNYATVMGIDTIIPVDVYIPGCPPRPEYVLDGLLKLQAKIQAQHEGGERPPSPDGFGGTSPLTPDGFGGTSPLTPDGFGGTSPAPEHRPDSAALQLHRGSPKPWRRRPEFEP